MNIPTGRLKEIRMVIEAMPAAGVTLDQLEQRMRELGNEVLERRESSLLLCQVTKVIEHD